MAGCECGSFQMALGYGLIRWNDNAAEWELDTEYVLLAAIYYCPYCSSELTQPENPDD